MNTDLRVLKTKNNLYNALVELMKEKSFEEIKVSDICTKALINRSTFYSHYKDKYELLSCWINDLKDNLQNELSLNNKISSIKEYYIGMINIFLNYIDLKKEVYLSIMINNRSSIMMDIIYDTFDNDINNFMNKFGKSINNIPNKIITKFYLGAVFNVGIEWLKNPKIYTKENIIEYLNKLIPDNI